MAGIPHFLFVCSLSLVVAGSLSSAAGADSVGQPMSVEFSIGPLYPHPEKNPDSTLMLAGNWVPSDTHRIDFDNLPHVPTTHVVVSDVRAQSGVNQHNYLIHHHGRFWAMWSDGPEREDRVGQVVKYATSEDGLTWSTPQFLTDYPPDSGPNSPYYNTRSSEGFRYIARGFWVREGQLLALASLDEAAGFFGPSLELRAFKWNEAEGNWKDIGVVHNNTINNFPPQRLPGGEWMMSRRPYNYSTVGTQFIIGGTESLNQWISVPAVQGTESGLRAEEPLWWNLPDGNQAALYRDNANSGYIFRSFSTDNGRTWSTPIRTNYPDARSKIYGMRLSDGRYAMVSNANPVKRDPLVLGISDDGLVFNKMFYVVGGRHVDYPHMIEHDGYLYIAHSGDKRSVEIQIIKLSDLDLIEMPPPPPPPYQPGPDDIIIDNSNSTAVTISGNWGASSLSDQRFGEDYLFMDPGGTGTVNYTPHLPTAGVYEVYAWWNIRGARYAAVPYLVTHANGQTTVQVDQNQNGGQWNSLGRFVFDGDEAGVRILANGFSSYVVADAVLFAPRDVPSAGIYRRFEIVEIDGKVGQTVPLSEPQNAPPQWAKNVSQQTYAWPLIDPETPYFKEPIPFIFPPATGSDEPFYPHNHCPDITWLPNGDMLAVWFSTIREQGTEMTILASRFRLGHHKWDTSSEFFKSPDRNMTGSSIFFDSNTGILHHINGVGREKEEGWAYLSMLHRTSMDNGVSWSCARPISSGAVYQSRHQVIAGMVRCPDGILIQPCDATHGGQGPTAIHVSADDGRTWEDPGGDIRGIHAGVEILEDGRLLAFGRGQPIDGYMPKSVSSDLGKTWIYSASPFPPISSAQRLVLKRLREGPLLLISFTGDRNDSVGMTFFDDKGRPFKGVGMFAALSYDEGNTWPERKLLTPGHGSFNVGSYFGASVPRDPVVITTPVKAEMEGYLAATQSPDGVIHLISSRLYYRFNLKWIQTAASSVRF